MLFQSSLFRFLETGNLFPSPGKDGLGLGAGLGAFCIPDPGELLLDVRVYTPRRFCSLGAIPAASLRAFSANAPAS